MMSLCTDKYCHGCPCIKGVTLTKLNRGLWEIRTTLPGMKLVIATSDVKDDTELQCLLISMLY